MTIREIASTDGSIKVRDLLDYHLVHPSKDASPEGSIKARDLLDYHLVNPSKDVSADTSVKAGDLFDHHLVNPSRDGSTDSSIKDGDLFDYHLVNPSKDALKFEAAASFQLPLAHDENCNHPKNKSSADLLVVSPYTGRSHLLDLSTVTKPNQLLAKALTMMTPIREDYATGPYKEIFNWSSIVHHVRLFARAEAYDWKEEAFYIVVFRSQVPPTTDRAHLGLMDEKSHEEAMESGGLLKYWFGDPDSTGRNLATCIWREFADAKRGSTGEGHRRAVMATKGMYTEWKLERFRFRIGADAEDWDITEWTA